MSTNQSILFDPELDERQLDKEVGQIDDRLNDVGRDVPVSFDADEMDGLTPAGMGGGGGGIGPGGAAGAAGIASRLPKTVAGVTVASAMPVALAGGVGLGMLSAMQQSSARLQTSSSILSQAWNNVWRPLGDKVDQLFIRDLVTEIRDSTLNWTEDVRSGDWIEGGLDLATGIDLDEASLAQKIAASVSIAWGPVGTRVGREFVDSAEKAVAGFSWPSLPSFSWPTLPDPPAWPGWPNIPDPQVPDWTSLSPGAPDWTPLHPGVPDWSVLSPPMPDWTGINLNLPDWLEDWTDGEKDSTDGNTDSGTDSDPNTGTGDSGDGGGDAGGGGTGDQMPTQMATGGRVTKTGVAEVHRGELVSNPDRLVDELASAVSQASGGGRRTRVSMDTRTLESKLDEVIRALRDVEAAAATTANIGDEQIARSSSDGKRHRVADTNPLVGN